MENKIILSLFIRYFEHFHTFKRSCSVINVYNNLYMIVTKL